MHSLVRRTTQTLLDHTRVRGTLVPEGHFVFASGIPALSLFPDTVLFMFRISFWNFSHLPVCLFAGNGDVYSDVSYNIPKEIKPSLVMCIDFLLPTKISFKGMAICKKTPDMTAHWWIISHAFLDRYHS